MPDNPRGWLITVAARRMTDQSAQRARPPPPRGRRGVAPRRPPARRRGRAEHDDTLILLFLCCHPALTPASAIALTLRAVGGLTTAEIARAFLVPEATMAQRISRAKQTHQAVRRSLRDADRRRARRAAALGAARALPDLQRGLHREQPARRLARSDLAAEAIRLARWCTRRCPDDAEVAGLLALMLLTDARRPARTGPDGELVPLAEQDRSPLGPGADRRGRRARLRGAADGRGRRVPAAGRDRRGARRGARRPTTPTGRRSSRSTGCSSR